MDPLRDLWIYVLAMRAADVVDVLLVASLIYLLLYVVRGTRAVQLLRGILLVVLIVFVFNQLFPLPAFGKVVQVLLPAILVSIPVIFQPELRRAFERLGRAGLFAYRPGDPASSQSVVTVVSLAAARLAEARHGALMVLERQTGLEDLVEQGVPLDAVVTVDLLVQIFQPNTPLHDGAVVIRDGRLVAARVVLPLLDRPPEDPGLGTRHMAALSITESTDAVAVVVSEETGVISLAQDGALERYLDEGGLGRRLHRVLIAPSHQAAHRRLWDVLDLRRPDRTPAARGAAGRAGAERTAEPAPALGAGMPGPGSSTPDERAPS